MNEKSPDVSIIIPTYNGECYLDEVLASIFNQKTHFSFETLAIDSGSSDRTLEIIRKHQIRLHQIPNHKFGHGKTRNLGAKLACGRYLVFLTQDATPANEFWLEYLVRPIVEDRRVAGVYSRHIPRTDCNPCEWRDIEIGTRPVSIIKQVNFNDEFQRKTYERYRQEFMLFSDVSSCIRKDILERMPFSERIPMIEDQEWCKRAIEAGYTVRYEATSIVYHSHNYTLREIYRRQFDYGASYKHFVPFRVSFQDVLWYTIYQTLLDTIFILRQSRGIYWKLKWLTKSPLVRFTMRYGLYKGLQKP